MSAPSFIFGGSTGATPESLKRDRAVAAALMQGASQTPKNFGEGLSAIGKALLFRATQGKVDAGERTQAEKQASIWSALTGSDGGGGSAGYPVAPAAPGGSGPGASGLSGDIGQYASAIKGVESGGKYDIVGPTHPKYGRALGAYQVMESNLPEWSQKALGRVVSPDEFLASKDIQDRVFADRFGGYVEKYGSPQDAASAWLTGKPRSSDNTAKDVFGTDSNAYVEQFNKGLGGGSASIDRQMAPAQVASNDPSFMPSGGKDAAVIMAALGGPGQSAPQQMSPVAAALSPLPPARTVEANQTPASVPMAAGSPKVAQALAGFSPQVQQAAQADPTFDGFARNGGTPAAGGGMDQRSMLMGVLSNPWASDDQKQFAQTMLVQMMKQNAPPSRDDMLAQQKFEYERRRDGVEDQRWEQEFGLKNQQATKAPDQPSSVREYEFAKQQGYAGDFVQFQLDQKKAGATTISNTNGGGMGVQLPAEMGARIGMGDAFLQELPGIEQAIKGGAVDSLFERGQLATGFGEPTQLWRKIESGRDALARNLTGAGMSQSEADNQTARYQISPRDSQQSMLEKLAGLKRDLEATRQGAIGARTGELPALPPGAASPASVPQQQGAAQTGATAPAPGNYRWNPQTGQMEPM